MKHKLSHLTLLVILLIFSGNLTVKSQEMMNLSRAIEIGLENNYNLKIADNLQIVAENNNTLGNAGFMPSLDLTGRKNWSSENVNLEIATADGSFPIERNWAKSNNFNVSADMVWTIFNGMAMFATQEKLDVLDQYGALNKESVLENTIALISSTYYRVILEEAKLNVLQNTIKLSQERKDIAETKYQVGKASKLEFLAAQVDFNSDLSALIRQREILRQTQIEFNRILARDLLVEFETKDSIIIGEELDQESLLAALDQQNPQLLMMMANKNIAYYEQQEIAGERLPEVFITVGYAYSTLNREAGQLKSSQSDGLNYGLGGSWNIFDGFNTNRRIQNAKIEVLNRDLEIQQLRIDLKADLHKVYITYQNSRELYALEQENFAVARENSEIALDRYRLGNTNALELREAQQNFVDAESRRLNAAYAIKVAEIELLRLSGKVLEEMN